MSILLVDDDELVRSVITEVLNDAGSKSRALRALRRRSPSQIPLLRPMS